MNLNDDDFDNILNINYITELEKSVLNNDYERIKTLLLEGETIYNKNKLCNSYLNKKYKLFHTNCIKKICYKTALYYAFLINYNILKYLYDNFKTNDKYNHLVEYINSFTCGCEYINQHHDFYDSTFFNFKNIYHKIANLDIENGLFSNDIDIINIDCLFNNRTTIYNLYQVFHLYKINSKIILLLLNQQYYEYYKYHLYNTSNIDIIIQNINYFKDDTLADINYINTHDNKNIFTLTILHGDNDNIINILLNNNCEIPNDINHILKECLKLGHYNTLKLLLTKVKIDNLCLPNCLFTLILQDEKIDDENKLDMLKIIEDRKNMNITDKLLIEILKVSVSRKCLNIISNNPSFSNNIDQNVITFAIESKKYDELDLLLKYGNKQLINGQDDEQIPLFVYLKETDSDDNESLNILKVLLRYEPNLNVIQNNETPLIMATKKNRIDSVILLLNRGANSFLRDNNNENCLHIAIKNNYIDLVKLLSKQKSEGIYLVNEPSYDMKSCLNLILEYNHSIELFKYLVSIEGINLNYLDFNNKNIIYNIIMNENMIERRKNLLIALLLEKNINIKDMCSDKNVLNYCIKNNYFYILENIINKLIEIREINIIESDIITAIKNNKIDNVHLQNVYFPAISFLRQNHIYYLNNKKKNVYTISFIYLIMICLVLAIIEKKNITKK